MAGDFTNREAPPPGVDLERLPEIETLEAVAVRFRKPVMYAVGAKRLETNEAIEFQVTTAEDFPIRALAPALFVGDVAVTESQRVGPKKYRFTAYGRHDFRQQAPITVGWIGSGEPERRPTKFTFRITNEEVR